MPYICFFECLDFEDILELSAPGISSLTWTKRLLTFIEINFAD